MRFSLTLCLKRAIARIALCKTSAEEQNQETYTHSDEERALEGTWCSLEIDDVKHNGYIVETIYELWHWETKAQYNTDAKTEGIFEKHVDQAQKEKQEASGFPESCVTESDKDAYIKDYYEYINLFLAQKDPKLKTLFLGCFARDELPEQPPFPSFSILNTDQRSRSGEHWLAFY